MTPLEDTGEDFTEFRLPSCEIRTGKICRSYLPKRGERFSLSSEEQRQRLWRVRTVVKTKIIFQLQMVEIFTLRKSGARGATRPTYGPSWMR